VLLLDEPDRMLDMGFINDIRKIMALLPARRQNLMFSATFSDPIRKLAQGIVNNPVEVSVSQGNSTADTVKQWLCPVDKKRKPEILLELIRQGGWQQVLVFTKTKHGANKLARFLDEAGVKAAAIHGNKSQGARTKALADFKSGSISVLVATDIAARGLDIDQLPQVVNFELPNVPEDYVHRIGRTGRAGATGQAVSLVCEDEADLLFGIERLIRQTIERREVEGYEPVHPLPAPGTRLPAAKRSAPQNRGPRKPKVEHRDGQKPAGSAHAKRRSRRPRTATPAV